jgi:hypothetical protein
MVNGKLSKFSTFDCHSRPTFVGAGCGNPHRFTKWIPAFAGMTLFLDRVVELCKDQALTVDSTEKSSRKAAKPQSYQSKNL